jgi:MFS family permease
MADNRARFFPGLPVDPRSSYAATEALNLATEAMRNAADAMSRAAEYMFSQSDATATTLTNMGGSSSRPGTGGARPEIPTRRSSLDPGVSVGSLNLERPQPAYLLPSRSSLPASQPPAFPKSSVAHVDLIDAVEKIKSQSEEKENPYSRYSGGSYREEVADRNIGGLYKPTNSSFTPLKAECQSPLIESDNEEAHRPPHPPATRMSTSREVLFISIVCMAQLLTQCALAQTIAPLPFIAQAFYPSGAASATNLAWFSAAFALTVGTFILPSGRLGDVYGHKIVFAIGWMWFGLFSLACGFAQQVQDGGLSGEIFLIYCRAMQGIGPAIVMPNGLALFGTTYPPGKKKNMIFALFGACAPAGFVIGATFSSLLSMKAHWSWSFWILGIVCIGLFVLTFIIVPTPTVHHGLNPPKENTLSKQFWATYEILDIRGGFLGLTGLILINISLNQAPSVGWEVPYTYFLLIIGLLFIVAFFISQKHASHPLIPLPTLNSDTLFVLACTACGWASMGIWIFYTWAFMENLVLLTPLGASAWFAPCPVAGLVASAATGIALSKMHPRWLMMMSMVAFFIGTTVMATNDPTRIFWTGVFWSVVIMPFGMDMSFPSATILVSDRAGPGSQGAAASLVNTVVNYAISVGLGLAGTVVRGVGGERSPQDMLRGFRDAWYMGMALSGTGIVIAILFCGIGVVDSRKKRKAEEVSRGRVQREDE